MRLPAGPRRTLTRLEGCDRMLCDRCRKRAYLRVFKGDLELNFCGHHATEVKDALAAQGWVFDWDAAGLEKIGAKVPA